MDGEKYSKIYSEKEAVLEEHLSNLEKIIYECKVPLEGNAFYHHQSPGRWNEGDKLVRHDMFINKQINLFWCGTLSNKKVCEVGFNAGHSALLLLLAREYSVNLEFLIFDICRHAYTKPCLEYIKKKFDDVKFEMGKVAWPSWEELKSSTYVVLSLSMLLIVFLFFIDLVLAQLMIFLNDII